MLRPGRMASPAPARAFTFELSPPESPHEGVEYNYAGKSANSRGRTCTGKTSSRMGCKQRARRISVTSVIRFFWPSSREEAHHMLTTPVQPITGTCTRGTRVSPSPSKIPYGGFSPVRLQTGIPPRPSPARSGSSLHPAPAYTRLKSLSRKRATSRSGTFVQAALSPSDRTLPSRGPWLASGFCCPIGSTLTMTSSETLGSSRPTYDFADRFPNLLCLSVSSVPPSVPRQTGRLHLAVPSSSALAFPISVLGRHPHPHAFRFQRGRVTRLQSSLYATARKNG